MIIEEGVIILDLGKSSGRIFGVSVHLGASFSCYFHILFTPWTLQNSHAEAFCLWKDDCLWKNKKRKKVLDKKKKEERKEKQTQGKEYHSVKKRKIPLWKWLVLAELHTGVQISNKEVAVKPKFAIQNIFKAGTLCKY